MSNIRKIAIVYGIFGIYICQIIYMIFLYG